MLKPRDICTEGKPMAKGQKKSTREIRKTKADKAEIMAAAERHGYKNLTHFVDDAIRYFIKESDRSRGLNKITTPTEYQTALSMVEALFDAPSDSPEEAELMRLVILIEEYEDEQYPMP
jgi:uncharacterized membrane-anchored protein